MIIKKRHNVFRHLMSSDLFVLRSSQRIVLKKLAKVTDKQLQCSLVFVKLQAWVATSLVQDLHHWCSPWILQSGFSIIHLWITASDFIILHFGHIYHINPMLLYIWNDLIIVEVVFIIKVVSLSGKFSLGKMLVT